MKDNHYRVASDRRETNEQANVWKGLGAGLAGGLVASLVMDQFQSLWSKLAEGDERWRRAKSQQTSRSQTGQEQQQHSGEESEKPEPATVKAAEAISENVFGHELTKNEKKIAAPAMHYAMGATSGAIYGIASEIAPFTTVGAGIPFGAIVWLVADEAAVPALGLSKSPTEYPPSTHAYALASHLIYGATTDFVRRAARIIL